MKNNYIVVGDSIVYGVGGYQFNGWVSMFKNKILNSKDFRQTPNYVHCVGFPGATSKDISDRIENIISTYYFDGVRNVFIVSIGGNDTQIFKGKSRQTKDEYKENINKIIKSIQTRENVDIIFLGLNRVEEKDKPLCWKNEKYFDYKNIVDYNTILNEVCMENKVQFISMIDVLDEDDFVDGVHPNDEGYSKILERVLLAINK